MKATVRNTLSGDPANIGCFVWVEEAMKTRLYSLPMGAVIDVLSVNPANGMAKVGISVGGYLARTLVGPTAGVYGYIARAMLQFDLPPITFTATPATIPAGQSTRLDWSVSNVEAVYLNDVGVTCPGSLTVTPTATTTYTLRVVDKDWRERTATVTVTVQPVIAPPPSMPVRLGVNNVKDGNSGRAAIAAGVPSISTTFNSYWGGQIKQAYPALKVAVRGLLDGGYTPTIEQWWSKVYEGAVNGMDMIGLNENDHGVGTSPDDIRRRIDFDQRALAKTKQEAINRGITLNYVGGGFSAGCPNIRDKEVIRAMAGYAGLMNDPHFKFNQHLYATGDGTPGQTPEMIRDLVFSDSFCDETMDRYNPATGAFSQITQRVMAYDWTIRRWIFYYTLCGWNPAGAGRIAADECGLDVGSHAGFVGMGCDGAFMQRWAPRFVWIQSQPIVINGVSYASPVEWCNIFQTGDLDRWATYDIRNLLPALQACRWGQA